jgi:hypothetical protein
MEEHMLSAHDRKVGALSDIMLTEICSIGHLGGSSGSYDYNSRGDAAAACKRAGYSGLCSKKTAVAYAKGEIAYQDPLSWREMCRVGWTTTGDHWGYEELASLGFVTSGDYPGFEMTVRALEAANQQAAMHACGFLADKEKMYSRCMSVNHPSLHDWDYSRWYNRGTSCTALVNEQGAPVSHSTSHAIEADAYIRQSGCVAKAVGGCGSVGWNHWPMKNGGAFCCKGDCSPQVVRENVYGL